jgi:predicted SAM-dependent methyltransferase
MNVKPTLSLAMIVRDSSSFLEKCLTSCHDLFDEIVIIDTGSKDSTKEIAYKYTDKVFDFEWIDDFAAARNYSFSKCTSDFICWLDDDDVILTKDKEKFKNLDLSDKEIVILKYEYSHDEFGVVECSLERERIVKRSLGLVWQKAIHEYLPLNGKVSREDISIHHFKKHGSSERNLRILEKIVEKDTDPRNFYYLGKEYADFGKTEEAITALEKFVSMNAWWEDIFLAYQVIAKCYLSLKNENKFFENIFKSIQMEPRRAEPYYELGEFYANKSDWSRAIHYFEECLNVKRASELMSTYYPQYYTWKPALQLVICYNNIGNVQKAYEYNELFLKFRPNDSRGHNNKVILYNSPLRKPKKDGEGKKLNLGCGSKRLEGYVNVDAIKLDSVDEVFDLYEIPYKDNSISSIYSEHSLEHVSFEQAKQAIKEWFRVLSPGGELQLFIPDLELCCQGYLNGDNNKFVNGYPERQWYKMTLFGAQRDENGSISEKQFHLSGFSKTEIRELLEEVGFVIDYLDNY